MPWVRIDDDFAWHPKVAGLPAEAYRLFVNGLCYCARYLTDGKIPFGAVAGLCTHRKRSTFVSALLEVKLWERGHDAYIVHDYHHYQLSAAKLREDREQLSAVRSTAGKRGMESRWQRSDNKPDNKTITNGITNAYQTDNPVPVPVPVKELNQIPPLCPPTGGDPVSSVIAIPETRKQSNRKKLRTVADKARADERVLEVFRYYVERLGRGERYVLSDRRAKAILAALENYSVDELKQAIDGCALSDWHAQNGQQDIELVCRDPEHIDRFKGLAATGAVKARERRVQELDNEMARALRERRMDDYGRLRIEYGALTDSAPDPALVQPSHVTH